MKYQHGEVLKLLNLHDDESLETEDLLASSGKQAGGKKQTFVTRFTTMMFYTVYSVTKNLFISTWWGAFIIIYFGLQLFALCLVDEPSTTPVPSFQWIQTQLYYITLRSVVTASASAVQIYFLVAIGYISLTFALLFWVGRLFWINGHLYSPTVSRILFYLVHFQTSVLFMPFITILVASMSCTNGITACDGGAAHICFVIGICVLIIAFVFLNCFVVLISTENNPLVNNSLASPHGRIHALRDAVASLLNIINTAMEQEKSVLHVVTVLCCCGMIVAMSIKYMPYYRPLFNRLSCAVYSASVWGGICLLISYALNDTDRNIFLVCLLMGLPLVLGCGFLYVIIREALLREREIQRGMSAYTTEVWYRCKWQKDAYGKKAGEYRKLVDEYYPENAFMLIHISTMFHASGTASLLASQYMSKSNRCRIKSIDHRYFIFRAFRRQNEEKNGESDSLNYMTLKHHQLVAETNIMEALHQIQYLFDAMYAKTLSPREIFTIANKVERSSTRAKENLDMLVRLTKSAPRTLLLYALYASEILFDFSLSKRLHRTAHAAFRETGMDEHSLLDIVTIVISGNEANIGVILDCSDNIELAYGHTPSEIIGTNVDALCPPPINNGVHERFLRHYIETAVNFVGVTRTVWIRHIEGFYVRCSLSITPVQDSETGNLIFQGKLAKIHQNVDFLGIRQTGEILFYSENLLKAFGLRSFFEKENGQEVKLQSVIPATSAIDFMGMYDKLANNPMYSETTVIETGSGESYKFTIYPKDFPQANVKFTVIDLQFVNDKFDDTHASESEDEHFDESGDEEAIDVFTLDKSNTLGSESDLTKHFKDDETGSAKSDGNSTIRAANKMRATIKMGIAAEHSRFKRFRFLAILFGLAFIFLTIASVVSNRIVYSNVSASVLNFQLSGDRAFLILESGVAFLQLLNNISGDATNTSQIIRSTIDANADLIEAVHETILNLPSSDTQFISNLNYNSSVVSEYGSDHLTDLTSFNSLVLSIVSQMRSWTNVGQMVCGVACQYVINNAGWDLINITLDLIYEYQSDVESMFDGVQYVNFALLVFCAAIVAFAIIVVISPRLLEVKTVKDEVSVAIGNIQPSTLKRICQFNAQRANKVSFMINHINKSPNPFQLDPSQIACDVQIGKTVHGLKKQASSFSGNRRVSKFNSNKRWCCRCFGSKKNVIHPGETSSREFRERGLSSSLIWSFISMSVPLLLIVVYFGLIYHQNTKLKSTTILHLNSINANTERFIDFQRIGFASHANANVPQSWSRWYNDPSKYNESKVIEELYYEIQASNNIVQYGNAEGIGLPFIDKSSTPDMYSLYFIDSCTPIPSCVSLVDTQPDDPIGDSMRSGMEVMLDTILARTLNVIRGATEIIISLDAMYPFSDSNSLFLELFETNLVQTINTVQARILIFSLVAILAIVVIIVILVKVFLSINNELVDAQSLFLLLPADVLDSIPDLYNIVEFDRQ